MANNLQDARGALVAEVLSGAWREFPSTENLSAAKVAAVSSLLYSSGSAALGWWRVRAVASGQWPVVSCRTDFTGHWPLTTDHSLLHDAYRRSRIAALVHEQEIKHVLSLLRAVDIEPVLVKGWAMARLYPDRALRPYGDIDLCVRPDQFEKAAAALKCLETVAGHYVDLHSGFDGIGKVQSPMSKVQSQRAEGDWDELFARSQVVFLSEPTASPKSNVQSPMSVDAEKTLDFGHWTLDSVRVLCPEDHLRLLCLHLLRSGAWRPLWLCDVALLLESVQRPKSKVQSPHFNWDVCLGRNRVHANWVACAIGLAHELLGVDIGETPFADKPLPRWLVPAVLKQWGRERVQRTSALRALYRRWDNPVRATAAVNGQFNNWPRLPYRLRESVMRSRELPKALASMFRQFAPRRKFAYSAKSPRSAAIA